MPMQRYSFGLKLNLNVVCCRRISSAVRDARPLAMFRSVMDKTCAQIGCDACASPATCTLAALGIGCRGNVVAVGGDPQVRRRLLEMGFCNGATVEVIRRAPLGDPIEFRLRGYCLSLRDEQAKYVQIVEA